MAKRRRRRRRVRVTPLGYAVLGILLLIVAVGVYSLAWKASQTSGSEARAESEDPTPSATVIPEATPTLPPLVVIATPIPEDSPAPVAPAQTLEPTPTTGMSNGVRNPSAKQEKSAVDGKLKSSGVVLRKGPDTGYDIIEKYTSGTNLKIFGKEGDYYFVRVVADNKIGYMAVKFIEKFGLLPGEEATPTPVAEPGTINGVVSASAVLLRSQPSKEGNSPIGKCEKDDKVWIYYKSGDFYYCKVVDTGEKGYLYAEFILAQSKVPEGTPNPS